MTPPEPQIGTHARDTAVDRGAAGVQSGDGEPRLTHPRALAQLLSLGDGSPSREAFARESARLLGAHFASPAALVSLRAGARDLDARFLEDEQDDTWIGPLDDLLLEVRREPLTIARLYESPRHGYAALVAAPIPAEDGGVAGAFATLAPCPTPEALPALAAEADAAAIAVGAALSACDRRAPAAADDARLAGAVARAAHYADLTEFAFALTNNLRTRLGVERVVFGVPSRGRVRLVALSGLDTIKTRSPGTRVIAQALEEAADLRRTVCAQRDDDWNEQKCSTGHGLHNAWRDSIGGTAVLSVPLVAGDEVVAVVGIRAQRDRSFVPDDIRAIEQMLAPFAAAVPIVARAGRSAFRHVADDAAAAVRSLFAPTAIGRKLAALVAVAATVWFLAGVMPYRVAAETTLAAADVTRLTVPFEAALAELAVEPGERVAAGQVVAVMDTARLRVEAAEARAELRAHTLERDAALTAGDHTLSALADARADLAAARLATLESRIASAAIRAPADGLLIRGDVAQRLGEVFPLGETLFEFAPDAAVRWEIAVPEHAADEVRPGMTASFSPAARPGASAELTVRTLAPAAETRDGRTVVIATAEAELGAAPAWLRPGMSGVSRVDAGPRPVWWVALHRVTDALHTVFKRWR